MILAHLKWQNVLFLRNLEFGLIATASVLYAMRSVKLLKYIAQASLLRHRGAIAVLASSGLSLAFAHCYFAMPISAIASFFPLPTANNNASQV